MEVPFGKCKGQPLSAMSTPYLAWLITRDNIRFKRWPLIKEALRILRERLANPDAVLAELEVREAPASWSPTAEQREQRRADKARKLVELEHRRSEEAARRRAAVHVRFLAEQAAAAEAQVEQKRQRAAALMQELARREAARSAVVAGEEPCDLA